LYAFNGRLELATSLNRDPISHHSAGTESATGRESSRALPLTADHLLLRGSRIKNTEWAIGCAVYTGQNTKLAMNSCITRSKISSSETYINKFLVFFLVILVSMVTVSYFMKR
jgi:phospholipid-translocating ATPase